MAKGAKLQPNALHVLKGSRRARPNEPEVSGKVGPPPAILTGLALDTWKKVAKEWEAAKIGSALDEEALACYCLAWKDLNDSEEDIKVFGRIVETERGLVKNPAFTIRNSSMTQIKQFAAELGLSPTSRGKIQGPPKKKANKFVVVD